MRVLLAGGTSRGKPRTPVKPSGPASLPKGRPRAGGEPLQKTAVSPGANAANYVLFPSEDVLTGWIRAEAV